MRGEVLRIIPLSCLRAGRGWVSVHLEELRGWRRSSNQPWPQRLVSWWLSRHSLPFKRKKNKKKKSTFGCQFIFDGRRGFTDYSTVMHSGGWRSCFCASRKVKWLAAVE
ncbi:hypothetical protein HanRHA438_Chr14g0646151 [Helianthus annuus]|nr:hypothetical protein HanRHA438_Chr14g0646151 [Helianthus annuus]